MEDLEKQIADFLRLMNENPGKVVRMIIRPGGAVKSNADEAAKTNTVDPSKGTPSKPKS